MATQQTTTAGRLLVAPSVILLFLWMIVPLVMTLYFSTLNYNLLDPDPARFIGFANYLDFIHDPDFFGALVNTLILVVSVLVFSVVGGILVALLMDQPIFGQNARPRDGDRPVLRDADRQRAGLEKHADEPGLRAVRLDLQFAPPAGDRLVHQLPDALRSFSSSSWQWLPFASLILLTALQSLDEEQKEAAHARRRRPLPFFFYIVLPHIARAITVVMLIETIFLLNVFAEIRVTTNGGPLDDQPSLPHFQTRHQR